MLKMADNFGGSDDDSQTVMAHGCHLSDDELALFRETGASLSHCPNSNIS